MSFSLRSVGMKYLGDETFKPRLNFSNGVLPTQKDVIEVYNSTITERSI